MKRVFAVFAAVVMLFSATACGDSDSESEPAKGSSAGGPDGTYRYTDIDGFGYLEDGPMRNYAVFDDGRFEWFVRDDRSSDKDYYKEYGYACKETGSYEVSDGVISLKYDDINTKEELFEQFPSIIDMYNRKDDSEKEAYIKERIEYQSKIRKDNEDNIKLAVDEDKKIIYQIKDPHYWRKLAYNYASAKCGMMFPDGSENSRNIEKIYKDIADKYSFISSEDEFDDNVSSESKKLLENYFTNLDIKETEGYTAEEGFTRNFDISRHSWLIVMRGQARCALVIGESADSDVFGSNNYWVFDAAEQSNGGYKVLDKEITNNFHSIRDVYNYYHSLNQS